MPNVEIHTVAYCPYCDAAKALLREKGIAFDEHDLSDLTDAERSSRLASRCGRTTVPQIWIDGRHIGGYTDLAALDGEGGLDPLVSGDG